MAETKLSQMKTLVDETNQMFDILVNDFHKLIDVSNNNLTELCWDRLIIIQSVIIMQAALFRLDLTANTISRLTGNKLSPTKKNKDAVFKAIKKYGDSLGLEINFEDTEDDWSQIYGAFDARNNLIHPKKLKDLEISPIDYKQVADNLGLFVANFKKYFSGLKLSKKETSK